MKGKFWVIFLSITVFITCFSGVASASSWTYVGKLEFFSGGSWTAYVDAASISANKQAGTVSYWVLFEFKDKEGAFKKKVKYETKLDYTEKTRYLEYHMYYMDNSVMTESNTPGKEWKGVDEETLLRGAIDVVYDEIEGNK